jgi:SAM-dependent methyltransferase
MTSSSNLNRHWSPATWSAVYAPGNDDGRALVFRRGDALAFDAITRIARMQAARNRPAAWIDVGTGSGHLAWRLAVQGLRVIGVDADPRAPRFARRSPDPTTLVPSAPQFIQADLHDLPLRDACADGVCAVSVLGCLERPMPLLREARRVLRPGGWLVITATNRHSPLLYLDRALGRLDAWYGVPALHGSRLRYFLHGVGGIRRALRDAGFGEPEIRFYNLFVTIGRRAMPSARGTAWLEQRLPNAVLRVSARNLVLIAPRP